MIDSKVTICDLCTLVPHKTKSLAPGQLGALIFEVRWQKVMLDTHLARIYEIPTFRFNEAIKRNRERFPRDFMFQLTRSEVAALTSQIAMSKKGRGGRRTLPYVFTEHGAIMAANVLNSQRAVQMSVFVVRAFLKMRALLGDKRELAKQLAALERELKRVSMSTKQPSLRFCNASWTSSIRLHCRHLLPSLGSAFSNS